MTIAYERRSTFSVFQHYYATVLPEVVPRVMVVGAVAVSVYMVQMHFDWVLHTSGLHVLGSFVGYFVIFRCSNTFMMYRRTEMVIADFRSTALTLMSQGVDFMLGPDEGDDGTQKRDVLEGKVNVVRLVLAFAVLYKLHTRVAYHGYMRGRIEADCKEQIVYDCARLRGLLRADEFERVFAFLGFEFQLEDNGSDYYSVTTEPLPRPTTFLVALLRQQFMKLAGKKHGYLERVLNLADSQISRLLKIYADTSQTVMTPLPLPYCHLCRLLMVCFLLVYMTQLQPRLGVVANIMVPMLLAFAFFGIDAIATEIEDPLGDDPSDLDTLTVISQLELEGVALLKLHEDGALESFQFVAAPEAYQGVPRFLALSDNVQQVEAVVAKAPI
mmetsp:Transcript_19108/g.43922  ORF Transcript_19108/g.43922 Transcript_19108/m.43922 type:complete len:385 (-) Transcript_19108:53-1207(-)